VFQQWEPLEDPSRGLEAVTRLKDALLDDGSAASPYAALVDDVVVGAVLASAAETWEAMDPEPMVRFLET
jgi:tuftelin-interacting protein 11